MKIPQELIWLSTLKKVDHRLVGGKANGLLQLTKLGLPVPAGFVLTPIFFTTDLTRQKEQLIATYRQLEHSLNKPNPAVAVRSSASGEDGRQHSFAGAYDTFLWVQGIDELLEKVALCRSSLFSERATSYRAEMSESTTAMPQMAIIIQAMVPARASGVMMTMNPSNGDRSKIAIESTWGLGQLLVDGTINPDRFLVDKITGELIDETITHKAQMLGADEQHGSGTAVIPVPQPLENAPSLTPKEIEALCGYGRLLENHFGTPQDIEFATYQNQIFILQARAETVWSQKQAKVYGLNGRPVDQIINTLTNFGKTKT